MNFVTNLQLLLDIESWERQLPPFHVFVGIPRSGSLIASLLAMRRNVKLWDVTQLADDKFLMENIQDGSCDRVLVVDDNASAAAHTFNRYRKRFQGAPCHIEYGVLYKSFKETRVDHFGQILTPPPIFEYDWHRRHYVEHIGVDLDGVICDDFHGIEQDGDDQDYLRKILQVKPLFVPSRPVMAIVTGRLEKWRQPTETWLARHQIPYKQLIMYPGNSANARRRAGNAWLAKAEFLARNDAWFFVESDPRQSQRIADHAQKPVFCPTDHMLY